MKTTQIDPHKSSLGMDANIASVLVYAALIVVSWIPFIGFLSWAAPIVFYVLEKQSKFVKFNAVTALIIGVVRAAIALILQIFVWILTPNDLQSALNYLSGKSWGLWTLLSAFSFIIGLAITVIILYLVFMAYSYKQVEIPGIGPIAAKLSESLDKININVNNTNTNQNSNSNQNNNNNNDENK